MGLNTDPLLRLARINPGPALSLCHSTQLARFLLLLPRPVLQLRLILQASRRSPLNLSAGCSQASAPCPPLPKLRRRWNSMALLLVLRLVVVVVSHRVAQHALPQQQLLAPMPMRLRRRRNVAGVACSRKLKGLPLLPSLLPRLGRLASGLVDLVLLPILLRALWI
jgi:hypothetical protein